MSVQVMQPGRQSSNSDGYLAYYGTYTLDEQNETVIHHVEACTPSRVDRNGAEAAL